MITLNVLNCRHTCTEGDPQGSCHLGDPKWQGPSSIMQIVRLVPKSVGFFMSPPLP